MPNDDDYIATSPMVQAIREMSKELRDYTEHADEERKKLLETVNATVEAMRKDVFATTARIQLDIAQHRDEHTAERKERAVDAIDRLNRQLTVNMWMGVLTALVVVNLLLLAFVVIRVAMNIYAGR